MDLAMSMKRDPQIQSNPVPDAVIPIASSVAKTTRPSCEQGDCSERTKIMRYSGPQLPEDIWCHIHALLPLPDAARAGCVSREFLRCWRCRPNLTFSQETLGVKLTFFEKTERLVHGRDKLALKFTEKVDQIMKKHTGIGVKSFKLESCGSRIYASRLKSWLQVAINPHLEELVVSLPAKHYNFPCPLLFNGGGKSISYLNLKGCAFHPMAGLGCLRKLHLSDVHITGDDLGCLLSNSFVLEELNLWQCNKITCLKIPSLLNQFNHLTVSGCNTLEAIENKAPNLCTVCIDTALVRLPFGDSLPVKNIEMLWPFEYNLVHYACVKLPQIMPNLKALGISSAGEVLNTPNLPAKFLHLKLLEICLSVAIGAFSPAYDYLSLAFLLDACPVLETFALFVCIPDSHEA